MVRNIFTLENKRVVVTGAGSGIGRATAILCAASGAKVSLLDISRPALDETLSMMEGNGHQSLAVDLTNSTDMAGALRNVAEFFGPVDGLVHCAGISSRKPLNTLKKEGFAKVMDVNFYSFVELVRFFAKRGKMNDSGKIVVMSSISSVRGFKAKTEYCVSKAAVDAFVRCMALELAPRKICINSVMASEVLTPMAVKAKEMNLSDADYETPLGPSQPEEIAGIIAFLLSDTVKTMTGSSILVDGGALQI